MRLGAGCLAARLKNSAGWLENHGDGGKVAILCLNMQALQDMAVPCVDAVEIADG